MLKNVRGIPYPSQVLAEQPDTINKSDIIRYTAHLSDKHMAEISRCIQVEMALGGDRPNKRAVSLGHDASLIFPQPSYDERIPVSRKIQKGFYSIQRRA